MGMFLSLAYYFLVRCVDTRLPSITQFHLECLGLEVAPLDKWWCKECIEKLGIGQKIPLKKQPGKKGR